MGRLPIIAIVGRPNVGKSTLFNRLAGWRRALVRDEPGVTRDRIVEEVEIGGRRLLIVDTAGLDPDAQGDLSAAIQRQARSAAEEADGILFVVDGKTGLLPDDEVIAQILRRGSKPILTVVNKIDDPSHVERMNDFYRLGFSLPPRAISSEHGQGVFDALESLVERLALPPQGTQETTESKSADGASLIKVAIVGRPNVGKSSLVNKLLGDERMVVSSEPGTTRDAVDVRIEDEDGAIVLIDTAGIRRPGKRKAAAEQVTAILALRAVERANIVLQLIDASENVTEQDAKIASMVLQRGRPLILLLNKWDLLGRGVEKEDAAKQIRTELERRLRFAADAPVLTISAKTGAGLDRIMPQVRRLDAMACMRIRTSELNRWLRETTQKHSPAMATRSGHNRRPIKFFYGTQVEAKPPLFMFFCTDPAGVQDSYKRFLENSLRKDFHLEGVPIRIILRKRTREAQVP